MDRMYRGSMYVYDNGEYKLEADTGAAYDGTSKAVTTKECKVYKDGLVEWTENDTLYGEVVGTIPAGTTLNILYDGGRHYITYYVENDGIKGWIKEDYPNSCIEFVENQDTDPTETIEEPKETIEETYVTDVAVDVVEDNKEFKFTTKEIVIGSICLGAVIVLTAIVTMVLVNKKKKN